MTRMGIRELRNKLVGEGRIVPPEVDLLDFEPVPVPPGMPSASEILAEMREGERY